MKALVYRSPGDKTVEERPKPRDSGARRCDREGRPSTHASRRDTIRPPPRTTICGTDLHILKGDVATVGLDHARPLLSEDTTLAATIEGWLWQKSARPKLNLPQKGGCSSSSVLGRRRLLGIRMLAAFGLQRRAHLLELLERRTLDLRD